MAQTRRAMAEGGGSFDLMGVQMPGARWHPVCYEYDEVERHRISTVDRDKGDAKRHGPQSRQEIARKLGISTSGLLRGGIKDALTTAEIRELLANKPEWLESERATQGEVSAENTRIKDRDAERRARSEASD